MAVMALPRHELLSVSEAAGMTNWPVICAAREGRQTLACVAKQAPPSVHSTPSAPSSCRRYVVLSPLGASLCRSERVRISTRPAVLLVEG